MIEVEAIRCVQCGMLNDTHFWECVRCGHPLILPLEQEADIDELVL